MQVSKHQWLRLKKTGLLARISGQPKIGVEPLGVHKGKTCEFVRCVTERGFQIVAPRRMFEEAGFYDLARLQSMEDSKTRKRMAKELLPKFAHK